MSSDLIYLEQVFNSVKFSEQNNAYAWNAIIYEG